MKKTIILFFLFILLVYVNYIHYETKKVEVFLSGKVVAFELANVQNNTITNAKTINTSFQTVGTMTFIKQNGDFAALGHSISDDKILHRKCYNIKLQKIQKGTTQKPGNIFAQLDKQSELGHLSN